MNQSMNKTIRHGYRLSLVLAATFPVTMTVFADGDQYVLERQKQRKPTGAVEHCLMGRDSSGSPLPKVLIKKDRIDVMDENGNVKNSIPMQDDPSKHIETRIYQDKYDKVLGVHVAMPARLEEDRSQGHVRKYWSGDGEYYILDANGDKTLDIKHFVDATDPLPSPSGDYAVGWPAADTPGGPPIFYDANGIRNKWAHGFSGEGWPKGYPTNDVSFSPDGRYVAVLAGMVVGEENVMIVYDDHGDKLFEKQGASRDAVFSSDASRIAYYSAPKGKIGMVDIKGSIIWEKGIKVLPRLFSNDGRFLLVMTGDFLGVLRADTGDLIWKWEVNAENLKGRSTPRSPNMGEGFALRSLAAAPDFSRIVVTATTLKRVPVERGGGWRLVSDKDHILIFDKEGLLIHWETLPGNSFKIPSTLLQVSQDGQTIAVSMNDGITYFSMKHK